MLSPANFALYSILDFMIVSFRFSSKELIQTSDSSLSSSSVAIKPITVTADTDSVVLHIKQSQFEAALKQYPELSVCMRVVGSSENNKIQLKSIPFFASIDELRLQQLAQLCEIKKVSSSLPVVKQGDAADGFYYIISGRVEIQAKKASTANSNGSKGRTATNISIFDEKEFEKLSEQKSRKFSIKKSMGKLLSKALTQMKENHNNNNNNNSTTDESNNRDGYTYLGTLKEGEFFGELGLLEGVSRTATVITTSECVLLYLSRDKFNIFLQLAPEIRDNQLFESIIRKRTANSLKAIPIFSSLKKKQVGPLEQFDEDRLAQLGALFKFVNYAKGVHILTQGEVGNSFFIIVQGEAVVTAKTPDGNNTKGST
jgi:CRP-like cAMP-binding protein